MQEIEKLKTPIMVDFEVTSRCPYRCSFCEGDIPRGKCIPEMDNRQVFGVLEKLAEAGVFNVFLTGGEPLIRQDLPSIMMKAFDVGMEPSLSTSAYLLTDQVLSKLVATGMRHLQVSIQGHGDVHDRIVQVPGAFSKVMKNVANAVQSGLEVEVATVGLKENLRSLPELIHDVRSVGVRYFRILRLVPAHDMSLLAQVPPRAMVRELLPRIIKSAEEAGIDMLLSFCPGLISMKSWTFEGVHPVASTCPAGKTEFAIMADGRCFPCCNFKNSEDMFLGNILMNTVEEIWSHPNLKVLKCLTPRDYTGICGECDSRWTCYSARCVALNLDGDLRGDDLSCYRIRDMES